MTGLEGGSVQWHDKGFWSPDGTASAATFLAAGHDLFDGSFTWPVLTLHESALRHNIDVLAEFTKQHDLLFAPHGKTTMAPKLYDRQLAAGAWGITVATPNQAVVARRAGVARILIANEILDPVAIAWIAEQVAADDAVDVLFWVDSAAGVEAATQGLAHASGADPVDAFLPRGLAVLVDVGYEGGRTGCRTDEAAFAVAAAVSAAPGLRLAGVAGYEGGLGDVPTVKLYLQRLQAIANTLHERGQLADDGIVSCGGSAYFDLVAAIWADGWRSGFAPRRMLRSGAYVTHDDGVYVHKTPFNRIAGRLEAAIQVWAQVISAGDAGRVIVGMGKRDAPYDEGLPVPRVVRRRGADRIEELTGCSVEKMDDHHAYVVGGTALQPGDLIGFGISHPCTAFDKWQLIPVVDDDHRIVDVVRTYF